MTDLFIVVGHTGEYSDYFQNNLGIFESTESAQRFIDDIIEYSQLSNSNKNMLTDHMFEWTENNKNVEPWSQKPVVDKARINDRIYMLEHQLKVERWKEKELPELDKDSRSYHEKYNAEYQKTSKKLLEKALEGSRFFAGQFKDLIHEDYFIDQIKFTPDSPEANLTVLKSM